MKPWFRRILIGFAVLLLLLGGAYLILLKVWGSQFETEVRALQVQKGAVHSSELAPPDLAEIENAAPLLAEAGRMLKALNDGDELEADAGYEDSPELGAALDRYVLSRAAVYAKLDMALSRPRSRFPVDYSKGWFIDNLDNRNLTACARALRIRALRSIKAGDGTAAARDLRSLMRLSDALSGEPLLLSQLIRCVIRELPFELLQKQDLPGLDASGWRQLAEAFDAPSTVAADFVRSLEMERAMSIELCRQYFFRGVIPGDEGRPAQNPGWIAVPFFKKSGAYHLRTMGRAIELVRLPYPQARIGELRFEEEMKQKRSWDQLLTHLTMPSFFKAHGNVARTDAVYRLSGVYCRLRAQAALPVALDVEDPCTGKPILYVRTEGGFRLTSVGPNQADDGGEEDDIVLEHRRR